MEYSSLRSRPKIFYHIVIVFSFISLTVGVVSATGLDQEAELIVSSEKQSFFFEKRVEMGTRSYFRRSLSHFQQLSDFGESAGAIRSGILPTLQDIDPPNSLVIINPKEFPAHVGIKRDRMLFASSGVVLANLYLYQRFKNIWWSHDRTGFHLYRGWRRTSGWYDFGPHDSLWFHMDKLGHLYNARLVSMAMADLSHWVGLSAGQSQWTGAVLSSLFYLQIEVSDGHYAEWGFSLGDFVASEAGAFLPMLSRHFPNLNYFTLKWSYHSSPEIDKQEYIIEDYGGMTFWLSADIWGILPKSLKCFWPSWLNLALGYGVTQKAHGQTELYFAFDYDLTKIHVHNRTVQKMIEYLNFLHFPAPTIQLTPMSSIYGLYF